MINAIVSAANLSFEVVLHAETAGFTDDMTASDLVSLHASNEGPHLISSLRLVHVLVEHLNTYINNGEVTSIVDVV